MAIFRELLEQFIETATQQAADSGAAEHAAQTAQHITRRSGPPASARPGHSVVEQLRELVPILISRDREQPKQCRHRWHSTAHVCLLQGFPICRVAMAGRSGGSSLRKATTG